MRKDYATPLTSVGKADTKIGIIESIANLLAMLVISLTLVAAIFDIPL
jgi:hypothetical protein